MPTPAPAATFVPEPAIELDDVLAGKLPEIKKQEPPKKEDESKPKSPENTEIEVRDEDESQIGDPKQFTPVKPTDDGAQAQEEAKLSKKQETSKIRQELQRVLAEKEEQAKLAKEREERLAALQSEFDKIKNEAQSKAQIADELQKKIAIGDPSQHPGVREIEQPWLDKRNQVMGEIEMAGEDPSQFNNWAFAAVNVLAKSGEPGTEAYRATVASLRQDFIRNFPNAEEYLTSTMSLVREGVQTSRKRDQFVNELQSNFPAIQYREAQKHYETSVAQYEADERGAFNPPEDIKMNDPLNPSVILRAMIDGSESVRGAAEKAKAVVRATMLPLRPIDPQSIADQEDGVKMQILQQHGQRYVQSFIRLRSKMPEMILAYQVVPALWKELEELRAKVKEQSKEPSPHLDSEQRLPNGDSPDVKTFTPINPELDEVKRGRSR